MNLTRRSLLASLGATAVQASGAGKPLTFQLPAKMLACTVLVISPLISLMKDQRDALLRPGFRATMVASTILCVEKR